MAYTKQNFADDRVLTAENLEKMEDGILERIPSPPVAAVGQTIVVSEVDEDGKPTAWEAVKLSSGVDEWESIVDVTLEEEIKAVDYEFENPFRKIYVIVETPASTTNASYSDFTIHCQCENNSAYKVELLGRPRAIPNKDGQKSLYLIEGYYMDDMPTVDITTYEHANYADTSYVTKRKFYNEVNRYDGEMMIPAITRFRQNTYGVFAVGTRFRIFGVRA